MATGTITHIRGDKGYGFLRPHDGSPALFFHCSATPWKGEDFGPQLVQLDVTYEVATDPKSGKPRAENVRPAR
jgi:cold shock CspA family protein